ncbi:unnamed protein product [Dovyalis caffra]|uniref:Uncharacterized protein n=1 Tax=Dovyalis caffra TaxID=77055 RepID=A0AAV1SHW6_9ROSI|nr:unnamed protein product [Dovyalis caffra]
MAYYSSCYGDDSEYYNGEYSVTPYYNSYDSALVHDSVAYSSYNYNENQVFSYDPLSCYAAYDPASSYSRIAYSASPFSEPMRIEYDPGPYYHEQTRFIVSYNVSDFNEPEFEEYDPTPYDGGYDPAAIYGKPLPPSDKICYPRSRPDPTGSSLNGFSYGSIIAPYGKDEVNEPAAKPQSESKPIRPPAIEAAPQPQEHSNGKGEEIKEKEGDRHDPSPGYDTEYSNGSSGELGYDYGKQMSQIPSGYGLEAMDLCESLFGYWPCLSKYARNDNSCPEVPDCGSYGNLWKGTADYLFGSPNPYGDRRGDRGSSYGNVIYGYERHYQEKPLNYQLKYVGDSWSV